MGISESLFYMWKKKYSGIGPSELRRLRDLLLERRRIGLLLGISDSFLHHGRCPRKRVNSIARRPPRQVRTQG